MASLSASSSNTQNEWVRMLYQDGYLSVLKLHAFEGEVKRKSKLRSVCWKLFLEVLPEDQSLWVEYSRKAREEYERIKKKFIIDPHDLQPSVDLIKNNPLSQEEESPWHQFFRDGELQRTIQTDVVRTFPDELYFKQDHVRKSMGDVLFCYAKEHPDTSYRQGMHELLAPLMFVLQSSQLDEEQLQTLPLELRVVLDPQYMEHDAFGMFSVLMETMQGWYLQGPQRDQKLKAALKFDLKHSRPFVNCRHVGQLPNVSYKLAKIHSVLLKRFDPEVYQRLQELDVAPEVYGIRWIRLLFSREFPFLTTLDLWDAIFAEGNTLEIVDYLYVAMLINIRGQLLYQGNGYTQCMNLLMNYPGQMEVQEIVQLARHMRYPKLVPRPDMVDGPTGTPPGSQLTNREESKQSKGPIVKKLHEVQKKVKNADWSGGAVRLPQEHSKKPHFGPVTQSRLHSSRSGDKVASTRSHPETVVPVALAIDQANKMDAIAEIIGEELAQNPHQFRARPHSGSSVEHLEQRLDDLETLRKYCGSKMDSQIDILQHAVYAMELNVEECGDVYTALAELKQVRDLLLGQLSFSGAIMDLSAPPTSHGPTPTKTHSREGDTQEVGHVTGISEVGHTGSASEAGTTSDDDIINIPTHSHPIQPHQCEAPPGHDSAPPTPSSEAGRLSPPTPPQVTEECPSSVPSSQLEVVEGEVQDTDLLSDYTVLSLTPSVVGMGEGKSHDSHVTGGEAQ